MINIFEQDVFYDISHLDIKQFKQLLKDAHSDSYEWHFDVLDCSESCARKKIDIDFDQALKYIDSKCPKYFIHRVKDDYLEMGFYTRKGDINYYMFIYCDMCNLEYFIIKHDVRVKDENNSTK